ncbi:DNA-binding response regulator [Dokdonia pacifica]|uniref:Two component transcriptional regulator, LytTR family n=1 Tax=Dokdonia pacifica TaxID=1627892 RepID=A0A239DCD6_9FLAO|nr:LytTR family DNA-binding domain-containing protein [Dokdonia pacifica]GGG39968.1 DNA-binding response regulator [Dokdonia pacifica]SNS29990.1 two component transcriptional regulator, LytTR family [Dokdonia pacifica]
MHILIIEDEIPAFEKLRLYIAHYLKGDFTYDWARSITETHHFLETHSYSIIFSDIQLLDGLSFEVFEKTTLKTPIIFCSAYDAFLLDAFKSNGIAYILKPYTQEDINQAFSKYTSLFTEQINPQVYTDIKHTLSDVKDTYKKRFVIKSKKGLHILESAQIALIHAEGDFCKLIDCDGHTHLYSQNIGNIYAVLDPHQFFRINRSQVIQLSYILKMESHFKNRLVLSMKGLKDKVMTSSGTTANFRLWLDR